MTTDIIKNLGLCEAIKNLTQDTMEASSIKITYELKSFIETSVNDKFKLNVFRIVQEHLNNILKHAKATEVAIMLSIFGILGKDPCMRNNQQNNIFKFFIIIEHYG